jgi:hypothetical protein
LHQSAQPQKWYRRAFDQLGLEGVKPKFNDVGVDDAAGEDVTLMPLRKEISFGPLPLRPFITTHFVKEEVRVWASLVPSYDGGLVVGVGWLAKRNILSVESGFLVLEVTVTWLAQK